VSTRGGRPGAQHRQAAHDEAARVYRRIVPQYHNVGSFVAAVVAAISSSSVPDPDEEERDDQHHR
jgi:hypothetical protein